MIEESIHIKFDDKEPDSKISKLVESFLEFHASEDTLEVGGLEVTKPSEADVLEVDPTSKAHPEKKASEEAHDGSQEAIQSNKTFKYKFSYSEQQII